MSIAPTERTSVSPPSRRRSAPDLGSERSLAAEAAEAVKQGASIRGAADVDFDSAVLESAVGEPDSASRSNAPPAFVRTVDGQRPSERPDRVVRSTVIRGLFTAATFLFLGLAAAGAFLPLLPTTPFLLLAVACASRVSTTWRERLLASRWGLPVRQWREHRGISLDVRRRAALAIALVAAFGLWGAAGDLRLLVPVTLGSTIGLVALYRLPLIERRRG